MVQKMMLTESHYTGRVSSRNLAFSSIALTFPRWKESFIDIHLFVFSSLFFLRFQYLIVFLLTSYRIILRLYILEGYFKGIFACIKIHRMMVEYSFFIFLILFSKNKVDFSLFSKKKSYLMLVLRNYPLIFTFNHLRNELQIQFLCIILQTNSFLHEEWSDIKLIVKSKEKEIKGSWE